MNRFPFIIGALLLIGALNLNAQQVDKGKIVVAPGMEVTKLSEHAYFYVSWDDMGSFGVVPCNGLILVDEKKAALLDTPSTNDRTALLTGWIQKHLHAKLTTFIPNHWHGDCMGGLSYLKKKGVRSYANKMTVDIARKKNLPLPEYGFADSLTVKLGGMNIHCYYPGGGHSIDNIVVWIPSEKILFGGCMVKDMSATGLGNLSDAVVSEWPSTITKVIARYPDAQWVIPGHGAFGGKELLLHTLDLLKNSSVNNRGTQLVMQQPASKIAITESEKTLDSQWKGKRVAFLGDSMTDKRRVGTTCVYWEYLAELLGVDPHVYGINGNQWSDIYRQAVKLHNAEGEEIDAILVFAGTNDYMHGVPIGTFFNETVEKTNYNGQEVLRKHRTPIMNDTTFCGRINKTMAYLKKNFPEQQIIIMTPIHRSYARFGDNNIQPDEYFSNSQGLYIDAYIDTLKQAALYWAVPLIDLYSLSGLYPMEESHWQYFHNKDTDRLHPNALGDYRLARTIQYQLLALPSTFIVK